MKDPNIIRVVEKIRTTVGKYYGTTRLDRCPNCPLVSTRVSSKELQVMRTKISAQHSHQIADITTGCAAPDEPATPALRTFQDAIDHVERSMDCSIPARRGRKTAVRQIAWAMAMIEARRSGQYLNPDRKALDLARMPFDLPAINQALAGVSYRMAGFNSDKSCRNAKWTLRRIGRELGMVAPHRAPELPPDTPYAPLLAVANEFEAASARRFAAWMMQEGRSPSDVTSDDLTRYGAFLATQMVGVRIAPMLRKIVQLWRRAAARHPSWPQVAPTLAGEAKPFNPPFSAYPVSLQEEIAALGRWMEGTDRRGPFRAQCHRKPLRPATIKLRLACIRLILGAHVGQGNDPRSLTSLAVLLMSPETIEAILQAIWERGQIRRQAMPEAEREPDRNGNTGQLDAVAVTLLMLAQLRSRRRPTR